jgi:hypothetical protein
MIHSFNNMCQPRSNTTSVSRLSVPGKKKYAVALVNRHPAASSTSVSHMSAGNPHDKYTNRLTLFFDCPGVGVDCPAVLSLAVLQGPSAPAAEGCWEALLKGGFGRSTPWSKGPVNMVNTPGSRPLRGGSTTITSASAAAAAGEDVVGLGSGKEETTPCL